jgi:ABC-2 type transport system ATP-binding protein
LVDCNLQVPTGIVFGLLGPNGAGKSTLLRILMGYLKPSAGRAFILAHDVVKNSLAARREVAYLPGEPRLYRPMRGRQILELFSGLHPQGSLAKALRIADQLDLDLSRRVMFMSTGMRQKLALSIVLGCETPLVILDEPTANLDPNVRDIVLGLIRDVQQQGRTVLLSSHIFSDIDQTCERVVILKEGAVVAQQRMAELMQTHIVSSVLAGGSEGNLSNLELRPKFVDHLSFTEAKNSPTEVEMHLLGSPHEWLGWLAEQEIRPLQIERAGIEAIYRRYHAPQVGNAASDRVGSVRESLGP